MFAEYVNMMLLHHQQTDGILYQVCDDNCAEKVSQLQLNVIDVFCNSTGMKINVDKTEIIVFRNVTMDLCVIMKYGISLVKTFKLCHCISIWGSFLVPNCHGHKRGTNKLHKLTMLF